MQEHIRRAHPENYISKLPATEESFLLMISTPPSERPLAQNVAGPHAQGTDSKAYPPDRNALFRDESSAPVTPRHADEHVGRPASGSLLPAASAAAALAQLGGQHKFETDWDSETVCRRFWPPGSPVVPLTELPRDGIPIPRGGESPGVQLNCLRYNIMLIRLASHSLR